MNANRVVALAILAAAACGGDNAVQPEPTPSERIEAARNAPDGATYQVIAHVLVTFLKPLVGSEPAGFSIQAQSVGPALFVAVDPATLTPPPVVGDDVTFTVTVMGTTGGMRQAMGIAGWARESQGNSIGPLVQNVSNRADLVSNVTGYETEVIHAAGTITSAFSTSGPGFSASSVSTLGLPADPSLKLRVPTSLALSLDLASGCNFTLDDVPLWRNGATAQLAAWSAFDVQVSGCPAPQVVGAEAGSFTSVDVRFDRLVAATSVDANGSQFTIPGLTVSAAAVNGKTVTLTTTAQTTSSSYTVTVFHTVTDTYGTSLNGAANTASFTGY